MTVPATTFSLALSNETATAHLMADLALLIGPGDVITLSGDLGAPVHSQRPAFAEVVLHVDHDQGPMRSGSLRAVIRHASTLEENLGRRVSDSHSRRSS